MATGLNEENLIEVTEFEELTQAEATKVVDMIFAGKCQTVLRDYWYD